MHATFYTTKNKLDYYRGKDYMKGFCKYLKKKHATKIINFEKKEMMPLTFRERESYLRQEVCDICKEKFITDIGSSSEGMFIKYRRVRDHCHFTFYIEIIGLLLIVSAI